MFPIFHDYGFNSSSLWVSITAWCSRDRVTCLMLCLSEILHLKTMKVGDWKFIQINPSIPNYEVTSHFLLSFLIFLTRFLDFFYSFLHFAVLFSRTRDDWSRLFCISSNMGSFQFDCQRDWFLMESSPHFPVSSDFSSVFYFFFRSSFSTPW